MSAILQIKKARALYIMISIRVQPFILPVMMIGVMSVFIQVFHAPDSHAASTLSNISPNPADSLSTGNGSPKIGGVSHMLKKEDVANVTYLVLGNYFRQSDNDVSASGTLKQDKSIDLSYGFRNARRVCSVKNIRGNTGQNPATGTVVADNDNRGHYFDSDAYVIIKIEGGNNSQDLEYRVPVENICKNKRNTFNVRDNNNGWRQNTLYNKYRIPAGFVLEDQVNETTFYRAKITISYSSSVREGTSGNNSFNFLVTANQRTLLGPLANANAQGFGIRSIYSNVGEGGGVEKKDYRGVQYTTRFGIPCNATNTELRNTTMQLFDPDSGPTGFGDTYMSAGRDGVRYPRANDYIDKVNLDGGFNASTRRWKSSGTSNRASSFALAESNAERGASYSFVISNPVNDNGENAPQNNVLSIGIPFDAIYADVPCNLIPTVDVDQTTYNLYPDLTGKGSITKTGDWTPDPGHAWGIYYARYSNRPTGSIRDSQAEDPCTVIPRANLLPSGGDTGCGVVYDQGNYNGNETEEGDGFKDYIYNRSDPDPVGTYTCFFVRVQNPTNLPSDSNVWRYSDIECAVSAKNPTVQFLGTDLRVIGNVNAGTYAVDGVRYGSWAEYGILSTGLNQIAASGGGYENGNNGGEEGNLTFTNTDPDNKGNFDGISAVDDSARTRFMNMDATRNTANGNINNANMKNNIVDIGSADYTFNGTQNLNGQGAFVILRTTGTVTINGDIRVNNSSIGSLDDLSQVVIIAKQINITNNARRVDAWLLADPNDGTINTCSNRATGNLDVNDCDNKLTVNGPMSVKNLLLRRTAGADVGSFAESAEIFRVRPEAQLWAYSFASENVRAKTVRVVELPPRY